MIVIHKESIKRSYTIHSVCTRAFCLFAVYWIAVIGIPVAVISIARVDLPNAVHLRTINTVSISGNHKVFVNGAVESWSATGTMNSDKLLSITLTAPVASTTGPIRIFAVLEITLDGYSHLLSFELTDVNAPQAVSVWFRCVSSAWMPTRTITPPAWSSDEITAKTQYLSSTINEPLHLNLISTSRFSSPSTTITAYIQLPSLLTIDEPSTADIFKVNLIFFAVVFTLNWLLLRKVYSLMLRERLVFARRNDPIR